MSVRIALTVFLWAATPLAAADGDRVYGPGVLNPDQVKQCLRDRNDVVALNQQLSQEKAALDQRAGEIERVETGLVQQQKEISDTREELQRLNAMARRNDIALETHLKTVETFKNRAAYFNEQVRVYNEGVSAQQTKRTNYNTEALALNGRLDQLRNRANEVDQRCAGIRAYQEDISAAQEQLGREQTPPAR